MNINTLIEALREYIHVLGNSADITNYANDRPLYQHHLAEAARIFADLQAGDYQSVKERIADEGRNFGCSFLAGEYGEAAECAWLKFASLFESMEIGSNAS